MTGTISFQVRRDLQQPRRTRKPECWLTWGHPGSGCARADFSFCCQTPVIDNYWSAVIIDTWMSLMWLNITWLRCLRSVLWVLLFIARCHGDTCACGNDLLQTDSRSVFGKVSCRFILCKKKFRLESNCNPELWSLSVSVNMGMKRLLNLLITVNKL